MLKEVFDLLTAGAEEAVGAFGVPVVGTCDPVPDTGPEG
jgi:hypothetical protein